MLHVPVRLSVKCEYYNIPGFVKLNPGFCLLGNDFVLPHGLRNALKTATTDSKKKSKKIGILLSRVYARLLTFVAGRQLGLFVSGQIWLLSELVMSGCCLSSGT